MDTKTEQIKRMLAIIDESSHAMPDYVFHYYLEAKRKPEEKPFYNLIAESFLTLFSFCKLMNEQAWSQAFALLRIGIEQVSAVFFLADYPNALNDYLELQALKSAYYKLESEDDRKVFLKENNIKKNEVNRYFDYGWISKYTSDGSYGRNQIIRLTRLEEFIGDIEELLNAFAHGSVSVFQMSGDNWGVMKKYGNRSCLTCCKLYDFLCCSYRKLVGPEQFEKIPLNNFFIIFKTLYHDLFIKEGWVKE